MSASSGHEQIVASSSFEPCRHDLFACTTTSGNMSRHRKLVRSLTSSPTIECSDSRNPTFSWPPNVRIEEDRRSRTHHGGNPGGKQERFCAQEFCKGPSIQHFLSNIRQINLVSKLNFTSRQKPLLSSLERTQTAPTFPRRCRLGLHIRVIFYVLL